MKMLELRTLGRNAQALRKGLDEKYNAAQAVIASTKEDILKITGIK